jgi:tRNA-dihydrouridine synthase 1
MASEGRSEMAISTTSSLLPVGTMHGELRNGGGDNGVEGGNKRRKLHGRAFYESIGSPKLVLAPMVEQSEFVRL